MDILRELGISTRDIERYEIHIAILRLNENGNGNAIIPPCLQQAFFNFPEYCTIN